MYQDRVEEALSVFQKVSPPPTSVIGGDGSAAIKPRDGAEAKATEEAKDNNVTAWTAIQYDYMAGYLDFYGDDLTRAKAVAAAYSAYPVPKWQQKFREIASQIKEAESVEVMTEAVDKEARDQRMAAAVNKAPSFELEVADGSLVVTHTNIDYVRLLGTLTATTHAVTFPPRAAGDIEVLQNGH